MKSLLWLGVFFLMGFGVAQYWTPSQIQHSAELGMTSARQSLKNKL